MEQNYIGENIRIYRERAKLTQQALADKVGVSWEMISRYERNASSPYNKLELLANALNVSKSSLLDQHIPNSDTGISFRLPLFTSVPRGLTFDTKNTNYFYSSPEWISKSHPDSFVLDSSIVITDVVHIRKSGVFYISRENRYSKGDMILIYKDSLRIEEYVNQAKSKVLGKLIAQEIRY